MADCEFNSHTPGSTEGDDIVEDSARGRRVVVKVEILGLEGLCAGELFLAKGGNRAEQRLFLLLGKPPDHGHAIVEKEALAEWTYPICSYCSNVIAIMSLL